MSGICLAELWKEDGLDWRDARSRPLNRRAEVEFQQISGLCVYRGRAMPLPFSSYKRGLPGVSILHFELGVQTINSHIERTAG